MRDGIERVTADELPSFLYKDPSKYDRDNMDEGLCMGPLLISVSAFESTYPDLTYSIGIQAHFHRATIGPK